MAAEEIANLNAQLEQNRQHTAQLVTNLESVRAEASNAVSELRRQIAELQQRGGGTAGKEDPDKMNLLNLRTLEPNVFTGAKDENYKIWSKRIKTYCNVQRDGFRKALTWAEEEEKAVDMDIMAATWPWATVGDKKLHDMLLNITTNDALLIVEANPEKGFEAWRLLKQRHDPKSGTFELDRMLSLMQRKQCSNISELPAAVDQLEKDLRGYDARSSSPFPENLKMPLLIQMIPKAYKHEIEMKFQMGQRDYAKLAADITRFSNDARVREQRGASDMDVDPVNEEQDWTEDDWWYWFHPEEGEPIDYMGKGKGNKGKSKGKGWQSKGWQTKGGKNNKGGNGKGNAATPGKGTETRVCHWCHKPGHLKENCKIFLAGKPKLPKPASAASLEEGAAAQNDWEQDSGSLEEDLESLEICQECDVDMVENADDFAFDGIDDWDEQVMDEAQEPAERCSISHDETPQGKRIPLLEYMRTPNSVTSPPTGSLSETILREQEEMRRVTAEVTAKARRNTPEPPGLSSEDVSQETSCSEEIKVVESQSTEKKKKKKAKKKGIRKKLIKVFDEDENASEEEPKKDFTDTQQDQVKIVKVTSEAEVQTNCSLPHTCRNVAWSATCYETFAEVAEEDSEPGAELTVGNGVTDLDQVEEESESAWVEAASRTIDQDNYGWDDDDYGPDAMVESSDEEDFKECESDMSDDDDCGFGEMGDDTAWKEWLQAQEESKTGACQLQPELKYPSIASMQGVVVDMNIEKSQDSEATASVARSSIESIGAIDPSLSKAETKNQDIEGEETSNAPRQKCSTFEIWKLMTLAWQIQHASSLHVSDPEGLGEDHDACENEPDTVTCDPDASARKPESVTCEMRASRADPMQVESVPVRCEASQTGCEESCSELEQVNIQSTPCISPDEAQEEDFPELTDYLENMNRENHNVSEGKADAVDETWKPNFITTMACVMIMMIQTQHAAKSPQTENLDTMRETNSSEKSKTMREHLVDKVRKIRYRLRRGITMDSGAANNVMPRRMTRNQQIRPSKGSMNNVHYIAANNGRIPNEGEIDFKFNTTEGHEESMVFQIAEVNKALGSISYLVDNGYSVIFDKDRNGNDVSMMTHKASGRKTRFRRDRNVWVLDVLVEENVDEPFGRRA